MMYSAMTMKQNRGKCTWRFHAGGMHQKSSSSSQYVCSMIDSIVSPWVMDMIVSITAFHASCFCHVRGATKKKSSSSCRSSFLLTTVFFFFFPDGGGENCDDVSSSAILYASSFASSFSSFFVLFFGAMILSVSFRDVRPAMLRIVK